MLVETTGTHDITLVETYSTLWFQWWFQFISVAKTKRTSWENQVGSSRTIYTLLHYPSPKVWKISGCKTDIFCWQPHKDLGKFLSMMLGGLLQQPEFKIMAIYIYYIYIYIRNIPKYHMVLILMIAAAIINGPMAKASTKLSEAETQPSPWRQQVAMDITRCRWSPLYTRDSKQKWLDYAGFMI